MNATIDSKSSTKVVENHAAKRVFAKGRWGLCGGCLTRVFAGYAESSGAAVPR